MDATLLKIDGTVMEIQPKNKKDFKLDELYKMLDCDTVEVIYLNPFETDNDLIMIGDEEARLKSEPIVNQIATYVYRKTWQNGVNSKRALANAIEYADSYIYSDSENPINIVGNILICPSKMLK